MLFPVAYYPDSQISARNLEILVARVVLVDVVESCLEIQGVRKECEVLGQAGCEAMKEARAGRLVCGEVNGPVGRIDIAEGEADAMEGAFAV